MKIKRAEMDVIGSIGLPIKGHKTIKLKGDLDLKIYRNRDGRQVAEVRRYVRDADLASEQGNDSDLVLMDWFVIHDTDISIFDERVCLTGYMYGALGARRDGVSPYTGGDGNGYFDDGQPLVRVEWMLR